MLQLGVGGSYLAAFDSNRRGGGLGGIHARVGRTFAAISGVWQARYGAAGRTRRRRGRPANSARWVHYAGCRKC